MDRGPSQRLEGRRSENEAHSHPDPLGTSEQDSAPSDATASPFSETGVSELLKSVIGRLDATNAHLVNMQKQNEDSAKARDKNDEATASQSGDTMRLQVMSNGSIIAVFIAALDVALLSYANDVSSNNESNDDLSFAETFAASCWLVSLALSVMVVTIGSTCSFLFLWELLAAGSKDGPTWFAPTLLAANSQMLVRFPELQRQLKEMSFALKSFLAIQATFFSIFVTPALLASLVGLFVFVWAQRPRLIGISFTVVGGLVLLMAVWVCVLVFLVIVCWRRGFKKQLYSRYPDVHGQPGVPNSG